MKYPPYFKFFFEQLRSYPIPEGFDWFFSKKNRPLPDSPLDAEVANNFIRYLRAQAKERNIKQKISDWNRTTVEDLKRIKKYVPALFDKYMHLMIVRFDINYHRVMIHDNDTQKINERANPPTVNDIKTRNSENINDWIAKWEAVERIDIHEVKRNWLHLYQNMRSKPKLFQYMVGYSGASSFFMLEAISCILYCFFVALR